MGAKNAALPEHGIDQSGLAMVDVSDDREVPDILAAGGIFVFAGHRYSFGESAALPLFEARTPPQTHAARLDLQFELSRGIPGGWTPQRGVGAEDTTGRGWDGVVAVRNSGVLGEISGVLAQIGSDLDEITGVLAQISGDLDENSGDLGQITGVPAQISDVLDQNTGELDEISGDLDLNTTSQEDFDGGRLLVSLANLAASGAELEFGAPREKQRRWHQPATPNAASASDVRRSGIAPPLCDSLGLSRYRPTTVRLDCANKTKRSFIGESVSFFG